MQNQDLVTLVKSIVADQRKIIGPIAIERANLVPGVKISPNLDIEQLNGEADSILKNLVSQYEELFGRASVEACKDSVKKVMTRVNPRSIPDFLK